MITLDILYLLLCSDRPSPPRNLHPTEYYSDFITVAWDVPEDDGGEPITGYKVERRSKERNTWTLVGKTDAKTLTIKATKLTEGHHYDFRVVAENSIGESDPCMTDQPVEAKLPFGKCCIFILMGNNYRQDSLSQMDEFRWIFS